jgi:hypothetical protein
VGRKKQRFFVFKQMIFPKLFAKKVVLALSVCPIDYDSLREAVLPHTFSNNGSNGKWAMKFKNGENWA